MIRLATYNVAWFNALFDDNNAVQADGGWSARYNVTRAQQIKALAQVFRAVNADAVLVVEAPDQSRGRSTEAALLNFAKAADLRLNAVITGFESETQQEIALFYDNRVIDARHDPIDGGTDAPRFDLEFQMDVDADGNADAHIFSKPPLEVALTIRATKRKLRLIGVHAKSKAPHGAKNEAEATRISIANRRKQLAQCNWLRKRVEGHLAKDDDLIVLGDFNDGPGLDEYEKLFGKSGIEVVMGDVEAPETALFDPHALSRRTSRGENPPATARFYNKIAGRYTNALLDFILISHRLKEPAPTWRIWHPFDDPDCFDDDAFCKALLTASDHFPVTIDIAL